MPEPQTIDWNASTRVVVDAGKVDIQRLDESGRWRDVPADSFVVYWINRGED